jgi:hypothetical protein
LTTTRHATPRLPPTKRDDVTNAELQERGASDHRCCPIDIAEAVVTSTQSGPINQSARWGLAAAAGLGIGVAAVLAAYARVSPGDGAAISTFGFSALYAMKSWLTTAAMVLVVVQVISALAMWGRLPGAAASPVWAVPLHRWSGVVAFVLTLPVAFQCIWSAGFSDDTARTFIHSLAGCLFYGAFAAKMLSLRLRGLPGWVLPVLGGLLAVILTVVWFSSAFWYLTQSGQPKF